MRDTHTQRERERQGHRQREKQAPCREPDVGLDPRSPGSRPGHAKLLSHRGCPEPSFKINLRFWFPSKVLIKGFPYLLLMAILTDWGGMNPLLSLATNQDCIQVIEFVTIRYKIPLVQGGVLVICSEIFQKEL